MSSSTYEKIQIDSDILWKTQRYDILVEYTLSPLNHALAAFRRRLLKEKHPTTNDSDSNDSYYEYPLHRLEKLCATAYLKMTEVERPSSKNIVNKKDKIRYS